MTTKRINPIFLSVFIIYFFGICFQMYKKINRIKLILKLNLNSYVCNKSTKMKIFFPFLLFFSISISFTIYGQPAYIFHEKGLQKLNKGDYAGAIKEFDTAIKKDKNDFEVYTDRGRANYAL